MAAAPARPNFVFIFSDDHNYQCLGANGNPHIQTPHLDRLAARGVLFNNGMISTPQCCPSRGVMLSGRETIQTGLLSNGAASFREGEGPTVISQLKDAGYDTCLVGKWHIRNQPRECGFAKAPLWLRGGGSRYVDPELCSGLDGRPRVTPGHITDLFTDAAIGYLKSATQPFFLWLAYNAPHTPWTPLDRFSVLYAGKALPPPAHPKSAREFDWATYYAVISHLDDGIGRVIAQIDESRLWNNTVIVFLGDNGFLCGTKGLNGKVHPWEESVRVPFMAAGGPVRRGVRTGAPAASIGIPATWMDFAGLSPRQPLAGRSLKPFLTTGMDAPEEGFAVWADGRPEALAVKRAVEPYRLVRTPRHKLIVWESRKQALYDYLADPAEESDLSTDPTPKKILAELRARLAARLKSTADPALAWL
jgi:arylsulfatase A-like enzyme